MDRDGLIRNMIATDDDYEDAADKILKTTRETHRKYVDKIRKVIIKNEDD